MEDLKYEAVVNLTQLVDTCELVALQSSTDEFNFLN